MNDKLDRLNDLKLDRDARSDSRGRGRLLLAGVGVAVLVALALWWWGSRGSVATVQTARVEQASAASGPATVLDASGYVVARRRATVSSKVTGKVVEIFVEEGMAVEEGQLLARLDDSLYRRSLALAEAELESARSAVKETEVRMAEAELYLRRTRELVAGQVASQMDLDEDQAQYDSLVAQLGVARDNAAVAERRVALRRQELDDTEIRAPFTGVAISKNAQPGEMISPISAGGGFTRTGICTLVDMDSLEIEVDVNEAFINRVRAGQRAEATLDAYPDWKIPASVITTVPAADRQKATVRVRLAFDGLDPRILPDMGIKVAFKEGAAESESPQRAVTYVHQDAVRRDGGASVAFVVRGDTVERRAVRTGGTRGPDVEVLSGLTAGEQVVVAGPPDLADGDRVRIETRTEK